METLFAPESRPALIFLSSLAIGLLVGLERERHPEARAGVRTFALITTFGTLCGLLGQALGSPWVVPVGMVTVAAALIVAYSTEPVALPDSGSTTIIAAVFCFALGAAMWLGHLTLAVSLGVVATVLLHFKIELEAFSRRLTPTDLSVTLQFAVLTLVILPLLPNRGFGPYQAINPFNLWLMVVLISAVGLAGYVSWRLLGSRGNTLVTGLIGGLISSTATTIVYARDARGRDARATANALIILLSSSVVFLRMMILAAAVAPHLLVELAPILGAAILTAIPFAVAWWRGQGQGAPAVSPEFANPVSLPVAISFGLLYGIALFLVPWFADIAGAFGLYAFSFLSGLTDVDAISLSSMRLHLDGRIEAAVAASAIGVAIVANLLLKLGMAWALGGRQIASRITVPFVSMIVAIGFTQFIVRIA
jgi:uncharacterized membrane protein (DUF4010 family)